MLPAGSAGELAEVLGGGGEEELVTGSVRTSEPQAVKAEDALEAAWPDSPEASRALRVRAAVRRPGPDTATRMAQNNGRL